MEVSQTGERQEEGSQVEEKWGEEILEVGGEVEEVEEVEVEEVVQVQVGEVDEGADAAIQVEEALPPPPSTSAGEASSSPTEESMEGPIGISRFDLNPSDDE